MKDSTFSMIVFFCLGVGALLPWNAVLSCYPFFIDKYPSIEWFKLGYDVTFYFPIPLMAM